MVTHRVWHVDRVNMGVRQLPSGAYQARFTLHGRQHAETFPTREQAEDWELITRARHVSGTIPGRITVRDYSARWLVGYDHAPANTRSFYDRHLPQIRAHLGSLQVARVRPSDVSRMLNRVGAESSVAMQSRVYRTVSAMFGAAVEDDLCPNGSPVRSKKHRPKRQPAPHVVLERQLARQVLLQLGGWHRDTALLQLSLGARFGEIAGLTPHDPDMVAGRVPIARRYSEHSKTVRATKNHRHRTLDIPRVTRSTFERLIREAGDPEPLPDLEDREWDGRQWDGRWLIQTSTGRPPHLGAYNKALKGACLAVGAPVVSSHGLRHTYVSWMIDAGHTAEQIAFWIGDTPQTVMQVYAHMLDASSAPAAAEIDGALGGLG